MRFVPTTATPTAPTETSTAAPGGSPRVVHEPVPLAQARMELLCDTGTFHAHRSAVVDGVLAGTGKAGGRPVFVWAQDGTHKGGSLGAAGGETIVRTIKMADRAGAPVVGFPHSGGARLQEGVASLTAYAGIFHAQSNSRALQISVIGGPCAGGAAYSPSLGDITVMNGANAQMFLTGPKIIEKVTREQITAQELGGAAVHSKSGVAHLVAADDVVAADLVRDVLAHFPGATGGHLPIAPPEDPPAGSPARSVPTNQRKVYDVRQVARRLVDGGRFLELGAKWAKNLVVGMARIDGHPVGIFANQPNWLGGVLDAASSDKGAWFVELCERFGIPMVVLVDTPGYLPGVRQEHEAVLRRGAGLLRAFSVATVPTVTITLRQAYGGAHIVMNSRDLGADLTMAWPGARIGVMGATQAVELIGRRQIEAGADPAELAAAYEEEHLPVHVAAAAGFVDEIVEPEFTRERIAAVFGSRR